MEIRPGEVIGGEFRVISLLGRGGMGAVYVAEQLSTSKRRALKVMHATRAVDPELRRRFEQEARVGARIASDHVVDVIAAGIDEPTGEPFLAMELLEGEDLAEHLRSTGPIAAREAHEIMSQLCHALAAAHAIGVVHRDIKPSNIFLARPLRRSGGVDVKVLDFGLAKVITGAPTLTDPMGTPLWMAPEQTDSGSTILPTADVWALGLLAFRLLTGRDYWRAANDATAHAASALREVLYEPIEPADARAALYGAPALPDGFGAWFARCVARSPGDRFPTAAEAWTTLTHVLAPDESRDASPVAPLRAPQARLAEPQTPTLSMIDGAAPRASETMGAIVSPRRPRVASRVWPFVALAGATVIAVGFFALRPLERDGLAGRPSREPEPAVASEAPAERAPAAPPEPVVAILPGTASASLSATSLRARPLRQPLPPAPPPAQSTTLPAPSAKAPPTAPPFLL